jgi:hypothetical protein
MVVSDFIKVPSPIKLELTKIQIGAEWIALSVKEKVQLMMLLAENVSESLGRDPRLRAEVIDDFLRRVYGSTNSEAASS